MIINKKKKTDNVTIFLHLPKTGGSTLNRIINKQYRKDKNNYTIIPSFGGQLPFSKYLSLEQRKRLEVARGHFNFGIHKQLPQKQYTYITILRDPIDRVISDYYFILRAERNPFHHIVKDLSLYEFVASEDFNGHVFNVQTRFFTEKSNFDLETAKNNLKKYFSIIGITERFDETLYIIEKKFGWKVDNYKNENVTLNRPTIEEIPNKVIKIIKQKNQKDIKLYELANRLLDKQIRQLR